MTEAQAIDFYRKAKGVGAHIVTMTDSRDYREWMTTALAVIVHMGDQLVRLGSLTMELDARLREFAERTLEAPVPDETPEEVTGVAWQGTSADYFDNFGAINHELAQNISAAARAREKSMKLHPAAIETKASDGE